MPSRWNTGTVTRLILGLVAGVATCGLLYPAIRAAGIAVVAGLATILGSPARVAEIVTRVWDGNGYMVWLAWVCAATAIAIDFVPRITWLKSIAWNGLGEGLILLVAILLLVQSQELPGSFFLQNLAGLLVFATVGFPLVALWRNTGAAPARVFDVKSRPAS